MSGELLPPNGRGARVIEVIEVVTREGNNAFGTLVREVTRYYTLDGELLATRDIDDPSMSGEPVRQCGQNVFDERGGVSACELPRGHDGGHESRWNAPFVNHSIDVGDFSKFWSPDPSRCEAARPGGVELCEQDRGHVGMHQGGGWIWLPDDQMCESVSSSGARCVLERGHWLAKHQSFALTPAVDPECW